jgi:hypothetical protein
MLKVANSVIDASRITGVLPVVNGGTGVTTSTGTGNTVLSASPTFSGTAVFAALSGGASGTGYSLSGSAPANSFFLDSSGNLGVGTATPGARFQVVGGGATSATFCVSFIDSNGFPLFDARNDGRISTGSRGVSPYNNTTANAANLYVDSAGILYRSTSSLKYKTDVQDSTHGLAKVMSLRSVTYKDKKNGEKLFGGLIAEEVHKIGLTEFVQYADDGKPDALAYGNMISLCIKAIQEQQTIIQSFEARLNVANL